MIDWFGENKYLERHIERRRQFYEDLKRPKYCPLCLSKLDMFVSGSGIHIGYKCNSCGGDERGMRIGLPFGIDGVTPALGGLNPCGIIEETWEGIIANREKAGLDTEAIKLCMQKCLSSRSSSPA